jgi:C1A family cysteine protease
MPNLNYFKDVPDNRDFLFETVGDVIGEDQHEQLLGKDLKSADKIDYRPYMSPVKNQGNLGSCVGFAVTALKEFQENTEYLNEQAAGSDYVREDSIYDLSEQWTYWNAKKIDPWGVDVEGTSIRFALKVLHKIGCPPEKAWEYTDNKINIGKPEGWAHLIARWNKIDSYWRLTTFEQIMDALMHIGPVVLGVGCYDEIFRPEPDGFVPYPKTPQYCYGGHAILACGFDRNKERVLFKNSWSTNWGADGYGWLGFDYIRSFCWDAWVATDLNVTRAMLEGTVTL